MTPQELELALHELAREGPVTPDQVVALLEQTGSRRPRDVVVGVVDAG